MNRQEYSDFLREQDKWEQYFGEPELDETSPRIIVKDYEAIIEKNKEIDELKLLKQDGQKNKN